MCNCKVLKWTIPDNFHLTSPDGVCILKLESKDIFVVWLNNALLITHISYKRDTEDVSFGKTRVLLSEFKIVDVLQLGDVVGIFCKEMLYLLQYTNNGEKNEPTSSRQREDVHKPERSLNMIKHISLHGVLMLKALSSGFALTKKKGYEIFVDIYDAGLKMRPVTKLSSILLPTVTHSPLTCVMTTVKTKDLDTELVQLLLQDLAILSVEVVFIGLGNGQVFYVPIVTNSNKPKSGAEPRILYSTTQAIKGILFLQGSRSGVYSDIAIILSNGPLIHISKQKKKLHYETLYLPSSVHTFCQAGSSIVMGDGMDLWHCRLTFPVDFEDDDTGMVLKSTLLNIKGVDALCYINSINLVLAVTVHLTIYSIKLNAIKEEDSSTRKPKDFTIPSNLIEAINRQEQCLMELHRQIANEDKLLGIINISKSAILLRNSFEIDVQVTILDGKKDSRSSMPDFFKQYLLKIQLRNNSDQEILPDVWSLHVMLLTKDLVFSETKLLKQKWSTKTSIENVLYIPFPITEPVKIVCYIVAELSLLNENDTENNMGKQWVTVLIAEATLDMSYFFELLPISTRNYTKVEDDLLQVRQELLDIVKLHLGEGIFSSLSLNFDKQKELREHVLSLTRYEAATLKEFWSAVASHCNQESSDMVKPESKMLLLIGSSLVKLFLNEDCTEVELRSENLSLLHHVKNALMLLLRRQLSQNRESFAVSANLLAKAQKLKAQVHMLTSADKNELQDLRQEWRNVINKGLPV